MNRDKSLTKFMERFYKQIRNLGYCSSNSKQVKTRSTFTKKITSERPLARQMSNLTLTGLMSKVVTLS